MVLELLFNSLFLLASVLCFVDVTIIAPEPTAGNMDAAQWPQCIFGLLVLCLIINIVRIWKTAPPEKRNYDEIRQISLIKIVTSKLFIGIVLLALYVVLLRNVGFIPSSLLFSVAYITLLGEKCPIRTMVAGLTMIAVIYALFINLEVMLPRGVWGFRDFHLLLEDFIRM